MSYVLDALKKAERERRHKPELGLDNLEQDDWVKPLEPNQGPGSYRYLWIFALCFGFLLSILVFGLLPNIVEQEDSATLSSIDEKPIEIVTKIDEISFPEVQQLEEPDVFYSETTTDLSLEALVDELRFEGSLYIEGDLSSSRVFIDGQAYFVGDMIKNNVYIKDITSDSATLSDGYDEVIRSLR